MAGISIVFVIVLFFMFVNARDRISTLETQKKQLEDKLTKLIDYLKAKDESLQDIFKTTPAAPVIIEAPPPAAPVQKPALQEASAAAAPQEDTVKKEPAPAGHKGFDFFGKLTTAKIFSWVGGFSLLLGVIFAFKYYSNYITPQLRIAAASALGIALIAAGFMIKSPKLKITANTLCASGLAILYGSVYAGFSFYSLIPVWLAFILMASVALGALAVAVIRDEKYIGFLGVAIGFLTPILLSTGQDRYIFFFSYIAFINAASIIAARRKNWGRLIIFTLAFTWVSQFMWVAKALPAYKANAYCGLFAVYVIGAAVLALAKNKFNAAVKNTLGAFICANLFLALPALLTFGEMLLPALKVYVFVFTALGAASLIALKDLSYKWVFNTAKWVVFAILFFWTAVHFNEGALWFTFTLYFVAAVISTGVDFIMLKRYSQSGQSPALAAYPVFLLLPLITCFWNIGLTGAALYTVLFSALICVSVFFSSFTKQLWPAFLGGAFFAAALIVFVVGGPAFVAGAGSLAVLFALSIVPALAVPAVLYGLKRAGVDMPPLQSKILCFYSVLMPYLLLGVMLVSGWRHTPDNIHIFMCFVFLLNLLIGAFVYIFKEGRPFIIAQIGSFLILYIYQFFLLFNWMGRDMSFTYFNFWAAFVFTFFFIYPFIFKKRFMGNVFVWISAALAGLPAFKLLYLSFKYIGFNTLSLIPLSIALIYFAAAFAASKWQKQTEGLQRTRLALLGGAALFFTTCAVAIQFDRQWLTIALALEGAALVCLNRYLDHKGLRAAALALLGGVFVRLVLNPAVFMYYETGTKIFNWYLYTYGICALSMFAGAYLWRPKGERKFITFLNIICGVTLFALLNIEIADYFTPSGLLRFDIFGSFAATVTYTLAWALYGCGCFSLGILKKNKMLGFTGLALIAVATVKLFIADIWALGPLYRIFGLFGIAVILILVSFALQKFRERVN